jgi:hypothetical protein
MVVICGDEHEHAWKARQRKEVPSSLKKIRGIGRSWKHTSLIILFFKGQIKGNGRVDVGLGRVNGFFFYPLARPLCSSISISLECLLPFHRAIPVPFTQEECQELMTLFRSFGGT